jgi:prophage maintenance system killer protein
MTWYPSVEDVIDANITVLDVGADKHPHKLLVVPESIQSVIDRVVEAESKGLTYQAALLMKELVNLHAFDGGNHRTASFYQSR